MQLQTYINEIESILDIHTQTWKYTCIITIL